MKPQHGAPLIPGWNFIPLGNPVRMIGSHPSKFQQICWDVQIPANVFPFPCAIFITARVSSKARVMHAGRPRQFNHFAKSDSLQYLSQLCATKWNWRQRKQTYKLQSLDGLHVSESLKSICSNQGTSLTPLFNIFCKRKNMQCKPWFMFFQKKQRYLEDLL